MGAQVFSNNRAAARRVLRRCMMAAALSCTPALPGAAFAQAETPPPAAAGCEIRFMAAANTSALIEEFQFDFESFETLCAQLRANNLSITLMTDSGNGLERSVAWAVVGIIDTNRMISSPRWANELRMIDDTTGETQRELEMRAVNFAMERLAQDFDQHLFELRQEEARVAALFGATLQ
ncbi:hypothetical protein [Erythrobacter sp. EC-HK427]|uniref:hypothetical protein n=1 Tax=Erythrobacter sp. EC-HK427 TaxID=2038396 RepID=UPI0012545BA0|nr:hypothetical protein [Erythrobacter sp. EC-HK427]VVT04778.1 exported hypothetical protein [Erythrobacter sp. EC-HK427]